MHKNQFNTFSFNNFKPFGIKMQTFSRKPITLIYGQNSVGKSSLIHMMAYRYQVRELHKFDMSEINMGDSISLGGFVNFIHKKNKQENIELEFGIDTTSIKILKSDTAKLVISIGLNNNKQKADIQKITYKINNTIFLELSNQSIKVNIEHSLIKSWIDTIRQQGNWISDDMNAILENINLEYFSNQKQIENFLSNANRQLTPEEQVLDEINRNERVVLCNNLLHWTKEFEDLKTPVSILEEEDTPDVMKTFIHMFFISNERKKPKENINVYQKIKGVKYPEYKTNTYLLDKEDILSLRTIIMHLAFDIAEMLSLSFHSNKEKKFMYIGPLRFYPDRQSSYQIQNEILSNNSETFWSQLQDDSKLIEKLNIWLKKLDIPYTVKFRKIYDLDELFKNENIELTQKEVEESKYATRELIFIDNRSNTPVHNREMGLGITQLLPVLGNSIVLTNHLIAIEQPELHLHPKLQAEIADEFIRSYKENRNDFLLETHSEHLLLRIMKRMRYTAENKADRDKTLDLTPEDVCILYVDADDDSTYIKELRLSKKGKLLDHWPGGFFEEGYKERFQ